MATEEAKEGETVMNQSYTFRMGAEQKTFTDVPATFMSELTAFVNSSPAIQDKTAYTQFCVGVTEIIAKHSSELSADTPIFDQRLTRIGRHEQTIHTDWGGVSFVEASESNDHVEKYLIVKQAVQPNWVLGFEYHNRKVEKLEVKEGYAIFMKSDEAGNVSLTLAGPGDTCELPPPTPHGVIALTNTAILETSNYQLDADDLLFIF
jgi:hypothetical protein